jgi:hypothetical protein
MPRGALFGAGAAFGMVGRKFVFLGADSSTDVVARGSEPGEAMAADAVRLECNAQPTIPPKRRAAASRANLVPRGAGRRIVCLAFLRWIIWRGHPGSWPETALTDAINARETVIKVPILSFTLARTRRRGPRCSTLFATAVRVHARFSAGNFGGATGAINAPDGCAFGSGVPGYIDVCRVRGIRLKLRIS